jgi:two-component system sensor histidine kinase ChiS
MEKGDLDVAVSIRSRDEIGDLGQGFDAMGRRLKGTFEEITSMSDAYARFVPREFLQLLGKEKIVDVELKQNRLLNLTILFADIRSFTSLSETMGPEDNFKFLNSYLNRMGPIIRSNHGFIDKYLGDGIMALFPEEPSDGVQAAVEMQQELYTYNSQRRRMNYPPIEVGIGVHSEKVILGIVGEKERMEGTVIGKAVNLAARLEGLTKVYGSRIIVSDEIIKALGPDAPDHRYLGDARVKGKRDTVPVHEIFSADPAEDVRWKLHTKNYFESGVGLFRQGTRHKANNLLSEAGRYFRAVLKVHPADRAAEYYVKRYAGALAPSAEPEAPAEA